jgi:hypothetical protein
MRQSEKGRQYYGLKKMYRKTSNDLQNTTQKTKDLRRVWRYQRGNQNPYIEEEQTTQWPKEKVQMDKSRSKKTYL